MKRIIVYILIMFFSLNLIYAKPAAPPKESNMELDLLAGFAAPMSASYVDTFENQDIYWNPNSGLNLDLRLKYKINDTLSIALPLDIVIGLFAYDTNDGKKVNTEAQAGNTPLTRNTEWSFATGFVPTLQIKTGSKPAAPYIGVGAGIGFLLSYESWDFTNDNGDDALLMIDKYYWPAPVFRGEIGWDIPHKDKFNIKLSGVFNMVNYTMRRVVLSHYYINGQDTINAYDVQDTVYSYGYDVPDENKGGDCLLAGFTYNNYPQQKISTNFTIKAGITLHL